MTKRRRWRKNKEADQPPEGNDSEEKIENREEEAKTSDFIEGRSEEEAPPKEKPEENGGEERGIHFSLPKESTPSKEPELQTTHIEEETPLPAQSTEPQPPPQRPSSPLSLLMKTVLFLLVTALLAGNGYLFYNILEFQKNFITVNNQLVDAIGSLKKSQDQNKLALKALERRQETLFDAVTTLSRKPVAEFSIESEKLAELLAEPLGELNRELKEEVARLKESLATGLATLETKLEERPLPPPVVPEATPVAEEKIVEEPEEALSHEEEKTDEDQKQNEEIVEGTEVVQPPSPSSKESVAQEIEEGGESADGKEETLSEKSPREEKMENYARTIESFFLFLREFLTKLIKGLLNALLSLFN